MVDLCAWISAMVAHAVWSLAPADYALCMQHAPIREVNHKHPALHWSSCCMVMVDSLAVLTDACLWCLQQLSSEQAIAVPSSTVSIACVVCLNAMWLCRTHSNVKHARHAPGMCQWQLLMSVVAPLCLFIKQGMQVCKDEASLRMHHVYNSAAGVSSSGQLSSIQF